MSARALIVLKTLADRAKAIRWIDALPAETQVLFIEPKRTIPQNSRQWLLLTFVAKQVLWHGLRLEPEDWKLIFMNALNREMRIVPNLDGTGFVNLGVSTSGLSKSEHSDLQELIMAWGLSHGVVFEKRRPAIEPHIEPAPAERETVDA